MSSSNPQKYYYNLRPRTRPGETGQCDEDEAGATCEVMDPLQDPPSSSKEDDPTADASDELDNDWDCIDEAEAKGMEASMCSNEERDDIPPKETSLEEENQELKKILEQKDDEIVRLVRQASNQATSEEYHSATSTPLPSLTVDDGQCLSHTGKQGEMPPTKWLPNEDSEGGASYEPPYVRKLHDRINKLSPQLEAAENRAKHYEQEYQQLLSELCQVQVESQPPSSKERGDDNQQVKRDGVCKADTSSNKEKIIVALKKRVKELEKAMATLAKAQQHSKSQSKQLLDLQDEAKARDSETFQLQRSIHNLEDYVAEIEESRMQMAKEKGELKEQKNKLEGELLILQAEKAQRDLEYEQTKKTLQSFKERVKNVTVENEVLRKQMVKFGGLQSEGRELAMKVAELQEKLRVVTEEKQQLQSMLEIIQAQVAVYKEDFEMERKDRERAFSERNEEGERYRSEIERLQTQLKSHKGNLSGLESIHQARQKELMQALEDLKRAQEEVQAKTSQVKQYKKQNEGLLTKVNNLETENKQLVEQFQLARKQLENAKKSSKQTHAVPELCQVQVELEKQTKCANKYKEKSRSRKAQHIKLMKEQEQLKDRLHRATKEAEKLKKERKKSSSEVSISSPVSTSEMTFEMEQRKRCQTLEDENQELKDKVKALQDTNKLLSDALNAPSSSDDDNDEKPTVDTLTQQPTGSTSGAPLQPGSIPSSMTTRNTMTSVVQQKNNPRQRSSSCVASTKPVKQTVSSGKFKTKQAQSLQHTKAATAAKTDDDIQHADYVNQSRIQAWHKARLPASLPVKLEESMALPPPIVDYADNENKMEEVTNRESPQREEGNMKKGRAGHGRVEGSGGSSIKGVDQRGWDQGGRRRESASDTLADKLHKSHEAQQHQLYSHHGPTSLPTECVPSLPRQISVGDNPPPQQPGITTQQQQEVRSKEKKRFGNDLLTPGINTEVHNVAHDVIDDNAEGEVTGVPYDPNLTCVMCGKVFRIGEIQLYRNHTAAATCGTLV